MGFLLVFKANVREFTAEVFDGCNRLKFRSNNGNICVSSLCCNMVDIILTPFESNYSSKIYFKNICLHNTVNIFNVNFNKRAERILNLYRFTLTDLNYGFKINGVLSFTKK